MNLHYRLTTPVIFTHRGASGFAPENAVASLLSDVFERLGRRLLINIELTNYNSPYDSLVKKTVCEIIRYGMQDNILFSSFYPFTLFKASRLLPEVPVALLVLKGEVGWWIRSLLTRWVIPSMIHPHYSDATQNYIQREHQQKSRVHGWAVNREQEMGFLKKNKVDGLITDEPILAVSLLEAG